MGIADLLWFFFMFSALQPSSGRRCWRPADYRVLNRFEQTRKSRAIALVHRQETMSFLGFPLMRYIDVNDSEEVLRAIKLTDPDCPIDLIVHTPGGLVLAAGQIAHALKRHRAKVTVFVPHYAMSGGTLICARRRRDRDGHQRGAGSGRSAAGAVAGGLDADGARAKEAGGHRGPDADPRRRRAEGDRPGAADGAGAPVPSACTRNRRPLWRISWPTGTWTHDYAIRPEEAKALGLPVSTEMPEDVYQFMSLFPQPTRTTPSVEYVPMPSSRRRGRPTAGVRSGLRDLGDRSTARSPGFCRGFPGRGGRPGPRHRRARCARGTS